MVMQSIIRDQSSYSYHAPPPLQTSLFVAFLFVVARSRLDCVFVFYPTWFECSLERKPSEYVRLFFFVSETWGQVFESATLSVKPWSKGGYLQVYYLREAFSPPRLVLPQASSRTAGPGGDIGPLFPCNKDNVQNMFFFVCFVHTSLLPQHLSYCCVCI